MLYHSLVAAMGVVGLVALWIAVQALVRKRSPEMSGDADVLACRMCEGGGECFCGLRNPQAERDGFPGPGTGESTRS